MKILVRGHPVLEMEMKSEGKAEIGLTPILNELSKDPRNCFVRIIKGSSRFHWGNANSNLVKIPVAIESLLPGEIAKKTFAHQANYEHIVLVRKTCYFNLFLLPENPKWEENGGIVFKMIQKPSLYFLDFNNIIIKKPWPEPVLARMDIMIKIQDQSQKQVKSRNVESPVQHQNPIQEVRNYLKNLLYSPSRRNNQKRNVLNFLKKIEHPILLIPVKFDSECSTKLNPKKKVDEILVDEVWLIAIETKMTFVDQIHCPIKNDIESGKEKFNGSSINSNLFQKINQCHQNAIKNGQSFTFAVGPNKKYNFKNAADFSTDKTPFHRAPCVVFEKGTTVSRNAEDAGKGLRKCFFDKRDTGRIKAVHVSMVSALNATIIISTKYAITYHMKS